MTSRLALGLVSLALTLPLGGCSVDPPLRLEEDPDAAPLALGSDRQVARTIALAPVRGPGARDAGARWSAWPVTPVHATDALQVFDAPPAGSTGQTSSVDEIGRPRPASTAAVDTRGYPFPTVTALERPPLRLRAQLPPREYHAAITPFEPDDARLAQVVSWAVRGGTPVPVIAGATPAELRVAAEDAGADLLVEVSVREARTAYVGGDGAWWWFDAVLLWGFGIPAGWWIADERFEVSLLAHVEVVHARSGCALLETDLVAREERPLTDWQRGWSVAGLLFLDPYFLDQDDWDGVNESLLPHARADLERQLASWLARELPARLEERAPKELVTLGDPAQARTWAVVIGAAGPRSDDIDRPRPLRGAQHDAEALARHLVQSRTAAEARFVRLLGTAGASGDEDSKVLLVRPTDVREAIERIGRRMLGHDRLIISYAGYGRCDGEGRAQLLLDGEALSLVDLAAVVSAAVPPRCEVGYILDTSFGGTGGRSYPGGGALEVGHLRPLVGPRWWSLVACSPDEVAIESEGANGPHGLLTTWLLHGVQGPADANDDGLVNTRELSKFLSEWVPKDAQERTGSRQTPSIVAPEGNPRAVVRVTPAEREG